MWSKQRGHSGKTCLRLVCRNRSHSSHESADEMWYDRARASNKIFAAPKAEDNWNDTWNTNPVIRQVCERDKCSTVFRLMRTLEVLLPPPPPPTYWYCGLFPLRINQLRNCILYIQSAGRFGNGVSPSQGRYEKSLESRNYGRTYQYMLVRCKLRLNSSSWFGREHSRSTRAVSVRMGKSW